MGFFFFSIIAGDYPENVTKLQIQNNGLHLAEVKFSFEGNDDCFVAIPDVLTVDSMENATARIFASPARTGPITSTLIGCVKHNPKPIKFEICCYGETPSLEVQTTSINFGKIHIGLLVQIFKLIILC